MRRFLVALSTTIIALLSLCGLVLPAFLPQAEEPHQVAMVQKSKVTPPKAVPPKAEPPAPKSTEPSVEGLRKAPLAVRGIYITSWTAGSSRMAELATFVNKQGLNAVVIDLKDDLGYVSYKTQTSLGQKIGAGTKRISNLEELLAQLQAQGIYTIARIVAFKDPLLAQKRPDLAFQAKSGGLWRDRRGHSWVSPYSREVWEYLLALGKEAMDLGFAEVQYDYVRFPSDGKLANLVYPEGRAKSEKIGEFLSFATGAIHSYSPRAVVSADTFGLAGTAIDDLGIGQKIEALDGTADYLSPMAYPSHYAAGSYGLANPNANPYQTILKSLADHQKRLGKSRLRPWLQAFTLGSPAYGPSQMAAQIKALRELGIEEYLLWNPASRYGAIAGGLK